MVKIDTKHKFNSTLIGIMLFNSCMDKEDSLYMKHSGEQIKYLNEKIKFIKKYLKPDKVENFTDKNDNKVKMVHFSHPKRLKYLYRHVYNAQGKKRLKKNIVNRFTEITFAIMYMDTGYLKNGEVHLTPFSITYGEGTKLQGYLSSKYKIKFQIERSNDRAHLWADKENSIKFLSLVSPVIQDNFPSMYHKIKIENEEEDLPKDTQKGTI